MRSLYLTSPELRGKDVRDLQYALGKRGAGVTIDAQYGPATEHAVRTVAYRMGLGHVDALPAIQRIIEGKQPRTPLDLKRAKDRAKAAAKANTGLNGVWEHATQYIGVAEVGDTNTGYPYPSGWEKNFGMNGVSWCGCFAGSMVLLAGGHVNSRVAYTPYIEADARTGTNGFAQFTMEHARAAKGWLVLYCWNGTNVPEHVGVVESFNPQGPVSVEGNTSSGDGGSQSNGGCVARRQRSYSNVVGYALPRFA